MNPNSANSLFTSSSVLVPAKYALAVSSTFVSGSSIGSISSVPITYLNLFFITASDSCIASISACFVLFSALSLLISAPTSPFNSAILPSASWVSSFISLINSCVLAYADSLTIFLALNSTVSSLSNAAIVLYTLSIAVSSPCFVAVSSASFSILPYVWLLGALSSRSALSLPCTFSALSTTSAALPLSAATTASFFSGVLNSTFCLVILCSGVSVASSIPFLIVLGVAITAPGI